jgi:hypothetical protein
MRLLLCTLLLFGSLRANDCVPLTYQTLSGLIGTPPVSYADWVKKLMPDKNIAPTLHASVEAWNKRMPNDKLQCIYVVVKGPEVFDCSVEYGMPYFWIGLAPDELIANVPGANRDMAHAAILIMASDDEYMILHTVSIGQFYREKITAREFFDRTYAVFRINSSKPITWQLLP